MKAAKQGWFSPNPTGVTSGSSTAWGDQTDPFQWRVEVLAHAVPALRSGRGVLREMVDICWLICWYMLIYVDICWYMLDICWWICWLICWFKNGDGSKFFSKMHGLIWLDMVWLAGRLSRPGEETSEMDNERLGPLGSPDFLLIRCDRGVVKTLVLPMRGQFRNLWKAAKRKVTR